MLGSPAASVVWAGVALLGLDLILARMAWLHNIIMVGGAPVSMLDGLPDAAWRAEKEKVASGGAAVELARSGRSLVKGLLTNLANPESDYLLRPGVFALFVGDSVVRRRALGHFPC